MSIRSGGDHVVGSQVRQLEAAVDGRVISPDSDDYDEARSVWNGMVDRRPALIVQCSGADDVVAAIHFAREAGLPITARGGGHGVTGLAIAEDGVVADLRAMNNVSVDADAKTARVGAGATLGDMDEKTMVHGLATTGGVVSDTGVAGLTLGGGEGWLARRFGLTIDNLLSATIVTADGDVLQASETENADLFWALRGGGGRFGIVTEFEFRLHELGPEVTVAQVFHRADDIASALRFYREFAGDLPDEASCSAMIMKVPPVEPFPAEYHGQVAVALVGCHCADVDKGMKFFEPLKKFGEPILADLRPVPYADLQKSFDAAAPEGERYYWKSQYLPGLSDTMIDLLTDHVAEMPGEFSAVALGRMGGAINRVDTEATAFPHRDTEFNMGIWAGWTDPARDDEIIAWTRKLNDAMNPHSTGGMYLNYIDRDDQDKLTETFGENHARLQAVKEKYDPHNRFRPS